MPPANSAQTAFALRDVVERWRDDAGRWLQHTVDRSGIVNGAGQGLTDVQARYKEPTTVAQSEIVVCAGAIESWRSR